MAKTETALARTGTAEHGIVHLTAHDIDTLVKSNIIPAETPPATIELFGRFIKESGLSPFRRQIHLIKRNTKQGARYTIQTGIDGYRATANRTGLYAGSDDYLFDEGLNEYQHIQTKRQHPTTATATVYKLVGNTRVPFTATARWEEYLPGEGPEGFMWKKMPYLMIGKCAEAIALRKAFPEELAGIYTDEEMMQADIKTIPVTHREIENVDTGTGELIDPPPPVQVEGTQLEQFDPQTELITFGKYSGMTWLELPDDYLTWLVKNATKKDIKARAEATIKYKDNLSMNQDNKSWSEEMFGDKKEVEKPPEDSNKVFHGLTASLEKAAKTKDPAKIKNWAEVNKTVIGFLRDEEKDILRKSYNYVLEQLKKGGKS